MGQITIAMLTHNALDYTRACISSVERHTTVPHTIVILDNGSTDETPAWLAEQTAPHVHVLLGQTNVGVPRGRNILLTRILPELLDDEYVVFLDNDTEVGAGWSDLFLDLFSSHPEIGIAGAMGHEIVVHPDRRELMPSPRGLPAPVDVVSGFCLWVRSRCASSVGYFDEGLGTFWHEDDDYCIRARMLGYKVFMIPGAQLLHHAHKSGVADAGIPLGGSPENQRYLVDKWRMMGAVDEHGRIRSGSLDHGHRTMKSSNR
jgi:O-antigen biosynthesis protein